MTRTSQRQDLVEAVAEVLMELGSADVSLRSLASAAGTSHALLRYHFGTKDALLAEVHRACEARLHATMAELTVSTPHPAEIVRAFWRNLSQPRLWPLYRLSFGLRLRLPDDDPPDDGPWMEALRPLVRAMGIPSAAVDDHALLWLTTSRGLLYALVTGVPAADVDRAAEAFFQLYAAPNDHVW